MDLSSKPDYMIFVFSNHLWLILLLTFYLNKHFDFSLLLVFIQIKLNPSCLWTFCQSIQPPYSMGAYHQSNHPITISLTLNSTRLKSRRLLISTTPSRMRRPEISSLTGPQKVWVKSESKQNQKIVTYSVSRQKCVFVPFTWLNYLTFQKVRVSP